MTQYVRVIENIYAVRRRPVGTILKVKRACNERVYVEDENAEKDGILNYYWSNMVEFIPEEISNSSLFKLMLDEQELE